MARRIRQSLDSQTKRSARSGKSLPVWIALQREVAVAEGRRGERDRSASAGVVLEDGLGRGVGRGVGGRARCSPTTRCGQSWATGRLLRYSGGRSRRCASKVNPHSRLRGNDEGREARRGSASGGYISFVRVARNSWLLFVRLIRSMMRSAASAGFIASVEIMELIRRRRYTCRSVSSSSISSSRRVPLR